MIKEYFSQIPEETQKAILGLCETYQKAGFSAILVGGSLRDLALGELPKDFDFATDCPIKTTQKLFSKVIPTGIKHGTVTLLFEGQQFEVTLFRKDIKNFGRTAEVSYGATWEEDQERRDLTINAIGFDPLTGEVLDSQGGLADLKSKKIRFVGSAETRVKEDHLRYLRYLRFIEKFKPKGFTFEILDLTQVKAVFDASFLSLERVYDEFGKIFSFASYDSKFLSEQLRGTNLFASLGLEKGQEQGMYQQLFELKDFVVIAFYLLPTMTMPPSELRLPKKTTKLAQLLLSFVGKDLQDLVVVKELMSKVNEGQELDLIEPVKMLLGVEIKREVTRTLENKEPFRIKNLEVTAQDLIDLGIKGKKLGVQLEELVGRVRLDPEQNQKKILLELLV